jgi:hypothetical protein
MRWHEAGSPIPGEGEVTRHLESGLVDAACRGQILRGVDDPEANPVESLGPKDALEQSRIQATPAPAGEGLEIPEIPVRTRQAEGMAAIC